MKATFWGKPSESDEFKHNRLNPMEYRVSAIAAFVKQRMKSSTKFNYLMIRIGIFETPEMIVRMVFLAGE